MLRSRAALCALLWVAAVANAGCSGDGLPLPDDESVAADAATPAPAEAGGSAPDLRAVIDQSVVIVDASAPDAAAPADFAPAELPDDGIYIPCGRSVPDGFQTPIGDVIICGPNNACCGATLGNGGGYCSGRSTIYCWDEDSRATLCHRKADCGVGELCCQYVVFGPAGTGFMCLAAKDCKLDRLCVNDGECNPGEHCCPYYKTTPTWSRCSPAAPDAGPNACPMQW